MRGENRERERGAQGEEKGMDGGKETEREAEVSKCVSLLMEAI